MQPHLLYFYILRNMTVHGYRHAIPWIYILKVQINNWIIEFIEFCNISINTYTLRYTGLTFSILKKQSNEFSTNETLIWHTLQVIFVEYFFIWKYLECLSWVYMMHKQIEMSKTSFVSSVRFDFLSLLIAERGP